MVFFVSLMKLLLLATLVNSITIFIEGCWGESLSRTSKKELWGGGPKIGNFERMDFLNGPKYILSILNIVNSEGLYSCLIIEGPVLDQWKNEIKIFSLYEGLYMKWKGVLTCFFHFVLYFDLWARRGTALLSSVL